MNELISVYSWLILVVMYFVVTLVVAGIRGYIDCRDLGWITGENIWLFFWPRFRLWLLGLVAAIIFSVCFTYHIDFGVERLVGHIGFLILPVMLVVGFICLSLACCLFMPLFAAVQGIHEID